jgi:hypothetical protein
MIADDIQKLDRAAGKHPLNHLEADIWRGVEARLEANRALRTILSCQVAVLALALFSSVAAGTRVAMNVTPRSIPSMLSVGADLSPSSRLTGY